MPHTYTQILFHIVFSTERRQPWLTESVRDRLYPYLCGIVRSEQGLVYDINGIDDHLHLFVRWRPDKSLSDVMRVMKARSSKWIHETFPELQDFAWQEGYSAFSVSKSREPAVKQYIQSQADHHRQEDFKTELLRLLKAHGVEYDERYVFD